MIYKGISMTIEEQKVHNKGIIDGVLNVLDDGLIDIDGFWSVLLALDFDKEEVLNTRPGKEFTYIEDN